MESWLSDEINDNEIFIPGFQIFRNDRNRHGGGVLIYVSLIFFASVVFPPPPVLEILTLSVLFDNFKMYICLFYRPPSSSGFIFDTLSSYLECIDVCKLTVNLIILYF